MDKFPHYSMNTPARAPEESLDALHRRANRLRAQGRYDESEALFRQALELAECIFNKDDVRLVPSLNNYEKARRKLSRSEAKKNPICRDSSRLPLTP